ncbi:Oxidoreductase short-chain dehydrogenase/reductase family [Paramagnetospirillum magnetotacticum MS-1]|uniref:Oxidoreductase short-chain dehydrogenase/reductase family n=1 Tax=Paramagnetospirillum magnetotacticum MS-1 TaxID=272627 RepID=A0A0C2YBZ4_PARME|nr:SDR family NAD(P)-dependent oxidoreductase [Paramagnetospirillum magnetotacticum]KIL97274.1 Oxidoreductase short-chain dehydrogenase/reductase family [Paramagnetospirillum magnetotacticum MS-1]
MMTRTWITGAGSGIGAALARRLATDGHMVFASGRRLAPLAELARAQAGIMPLAVDVTDRAAIARAVSGLGVIDTAILCAGIHTPTPARSFDAGVVRDLMETNLMGAVHCVEALLPAMIARGSGHLVLVASVAGYRGLPTAGGYSASKAGLIALAESLKLDLDGSGVRVSLINPGFVDTPLTRQNPFPMPDLITAEQAAEAILRAMKTGRFETAFPFRFALVMKLLRLLPDRLYFALMHKATGL